MNLSGWKTRSTRRVSSGSRISLAEIGPSFSDAEREAGTTTLQFRLSGNDAARLEALRETRRAMIREEWTRGLQQGEPSLAEAMFSIHGIFWDVPLGERARCREKLQTLIQRANSRLEEKPVRRLGEPAPPTF